MGFRILAMTVGAICASSLFLCSCFAQSAPHFTVLALSANSVKVLRDGEPYAKLELTAWGPNWGWTGWEASKRDGESFTTTTRLSTGATLRFEMKVVAEGSRSIALDTTLSTDKVTDLTMATLAVSPNDVAFATGTVTPAGGVPIKLPLHIQNFGGAVSEFELSDQRGAKSTIALQPAVPVSSDGSIRIILASGRLASSPSKHERIVLTLPEDSVTYTDSGKLPLDPSLARWFIFDPSAVTGIGKDELGLADWLETPAGKHGRILAKGDHLVYNSKPIKLWGINVCYGDCAPPKELADARASFYARNGINAVRLHKYADGPGWSGIQSARSFTKLDAAGLDRMDYFVSKLKEHGIYVELSPTFGVKLGREDLASVPYAAEFGNLGEAEDARISTEHGSIYLSRELQDLMIAQMTNLLKHRNPYTGTTYGEDPDVVLIEMFNEDSALFYGTMDRLQKVPTLRKRTAATFTSWLKKRYGTKERMLAAWGTGGLNSFQNEGFTGESWEENTIVPAGSPWFFDPDQLDGSQKPKARRLHDAMLFLYELQNAFYDRYAKALHAVGYNGEMEASNWIAGRAFSHFYNLNSDARIGLVDRHNYFGGSDGSQIDDNTMLRRPGSGILSTGMMQVADRPFGMSEWIHVFPTEWGAEGPAIVGAYGMGLQGWDTSFIFENRDDAQYSNRIGRDQWDATAPQILGLFPAVARQVHRNDVRESDLIIPRNVSITDMYEGKLGFDDRATADGDVKTSDSSTVPLEALAIAKCVVKFTTAPEVTKAFDIKPFLSAGVVSSSTHQLRWGAGSQRISGWFSIDSPGTQAVVGFSEGRSVKLQDVDIQSQTPFSAIYLTARDRETSLRTGSNLLVTAIARARNTDMQIFGPELVKAGHAPILLEPVVADIHLKRPGTPTVYVLDQAGHRSGRTIPIINGTLKLDTGRDKSCWYLISYH